MISCSEEQQRQQQRKRVPSSGKLGLPASLSTSTARLFVSNDEIVSVENGDNENSNTCDNDNSRNSTRNPSTVIPEEDEEEFQLPEPQEDDGEKDERESSFMDDDDPRSGLCRAMSIGSRIRLTEETFKQRLSSFYQKSNLLVDRNIFTSELDDYLDMDGDQEEDLDGLQKELDEAAQNFIYRTNRHEDCFHDGGEESPSSVESNRTDQDDDNVPNHHNSKDLKNDKPSTDKEMSRIPSFTYTSGSSSCFASATSATGSSSTACESFADVTYSTDLSTSVEEDMEVAALTFPRMTDDNDSGSDFSIPYLGDLGWIVSEELDELPPTLKQPQEILLSEHEEGSVGKDMIIDEVLTTTEVSEKHTDPVATTMVTDQVLTTTEVSEEQNEPVAKTMAKDQALTTTYLSEEQNDHVAKSMVTDQALTTAELSEEQNDHVAKTMVTDQALTTTDVLEEQNDHVAKTMVTDQALTTTGVTTSAVASTAAGNSWAVAAAAFVHAKKERHPSCLTKQRQESENTQRRQQQQEQQGMRIEDTGEGKKTADEMDSLVKNKNEGTGVVSGNNTTGCVGDDDAEKQEANTKGGTPLAPVAVRSIGALSMDDYDYEDEDYDTDDDNDRENEDDDDDNEEIPRTKPARRYSGNIPTMETIQESCDDGEPCHAESYDSDSESDSTADNGSPRRRNPENHTVGDKELTGESTVSAFTSTSLLGGPLTQRALEWLHGCRIRNSLKLLPKIKLYHLGIVLLLWTLCVGVIVWPIVEYAWEPVPNRKRFKRNSRMLVVHHLDRPKQPKTTTLLTQREPTHREPTITRDNRENSRIDMNQSNLINSLMNQKKMAPDVEWAKVEAMEDSTLANPLVQESNGITVLPAPDDHDEEEEVVGEAVEVVNEAVTAAEIGLDTAAQRRRRGDRIWSCKVLGRHRCPHWGSTSRQ